RSCQSAPTHLVRSCSCERETSQASEPQQARELPAGQAHPYTSAGHRSPPQLYPRRNPVSRKRNDESVTGCEVGLEARPPLVNDHWRLRRTICHNAQIHSVSERREIRLILPPDG